MLSHVDVYVRFREQNGTPFSYEPRKWFNCLHQYRVYPDGWEQADLHRRITCCWLSEYPNSLNLTLRLRTASLDGDLKLLFASLPGAIEVQIFYPTAQTPPPMPIHPEIRPKAEITALTPRAAA
jgi:hypothetical protein